MTRIKRIGPHSRMTKKRLKKEEVSINTKLYMSTKGFSNVSHGLSGQITKN